MSLKGKIAIVTGGSRGIGRAIVLKLASLGANVAFSYHSAEDKAKDVEAEASKLGVIVKASAVDVKNISAVKQWIDETKNELGGLDIVVNNAGIVIDKALMTMTEEEWKEVIDTNLNGTFNVSKAAIITLMKQKSGNIVNISSISGIIGLPRQINYSASKGGVNAFTKGLAKEVANFGIRVNAVAPGYIDTEILSGFDDKARKTIIENIPAQSIGSPDDVANCVSFLLSEDARYITGQIVQVDGGLALR